MKFINYLVKGALKGELLKEREGIEEGHDLPAQRSSPKISHEHLDVTHYNRNHRQYCPNVFASP